MLMIESNFSTTKFIIIVKLVHSSLNKEYKTTKSIIILKMI